MTAETYLFVTGCIGDLFIIAVAYAVYRIINMEVIR